MNSLKRFEYCSGFTVEISAPAWNTQDADPGQTGRGQLRGPSLTGPFYLFPFFLFLNKKQTNKQKKTHLVLDQRFSTFLMCYPLIQFLLVLW